MHLFATININSNFNYKKNSLIENPHWKLNIEFPDNIDFWVVGSNCWDDNEVYLHWPNSILLIFKVNRNNTFLSKDGKKWQFKKAKLIEKFTINKNTNYIKLWKIACKYKIEPIIYSLGVERIDIITDAMKKKAIKKFKTDFYLYHVGFNWNGLSSKQNKLLFANIKDEYWLVGAGFFKGITDKIRRNRFKKMKDPDWKDEARENWEM